MISALSTVKCSKIDAKEKIKNPSIREQSNSLGQCQPWRMEESLRYQKKESQQLLPDSWRSWAKSPLVNGNKCGGIWLNSAMGLNRITGQLGSPIFPVIEYLVFFSELPSELQIHGEDLWSQAIFYSCSKDCAKGSGERDEQALWHELWWLNSL